jgi:hypothetical protein
MDRYWGLGAMSARLAAHLVHARARDIAIALGGRRAQRLAGAAFLVPCPVPSHGRGRGDRNPSLQISDGEHRLLIRCYGGCDTRDVLDELRRRGLLGGSLRPARTTTTPKVSDGDDVARSREKARWLWRKSKEPGPLVARYLREARGYHGPIPATLRYLPPSPKYPDPALIAAFGFASEPEPGVLEIASDAVEGVHLIKLAPDGSGKAEIKPNKITIGKDIRAPIVLAAPNDLLGLAVTEGIENGLHVHAATGLGVWASASCVNMPKLAEAVPDYIEVVNIVFDDDSGGRRHAVALGDALRQRNFEVLFSNPNGRR